MIAAEGILTARGGVSSHAALVARQMGKVCVCGAADLDIDYKSRTVKVNGSTYKEGEYLSINGTTGEIFAGELKTAPSEIIQVLIDKKLNPKKSRDYRNFSQLMDWCEKATKMNVRTNADLRLKLPMLLPSGLPELDFAELSICSSKETVLMQCVK